MGSQQLFLLVLSLILVALLVYSGFQYSGDYYQNFHREKLIDHIHNLHNNAVHYKKKATEFGGGSGSYDGWTVPKNQLNSDNFSIRYSVLDDGISYIAEGNVLGWDNESGVRIVIKYRDKQSKTIRYLN